MDRIKVDSKVTADNPGMIGRHMYPPFDSSSPVCYDRDMTAEQQAFERGFLAGFREGKAISIYNQNPYPQPGIIWSDGMHGPSYVGDSTNPNVNVLNCDTYNADRLRND